MGSKQKTAEATRAIFSTGFFLDDHVRSIPLRRYLVAKTMTICVLHVIVEPTPWKTVQDNATESVLSSIGTAARPEGTP